MGSAQFAPFLFLPFPSPHRPLTSQGEVLNVGRAEVEAGKRALECARIIKKVAGEMSVVAKGVYEMNHFHKLRPEETV